MQTSPKFRLALYMYIGGTHYSKVIGGRRAPQKPWSYTKEQGLTCQIMGYVHWAENFHHAILYPVSEP